MMVSALVMGVLGIAASFFPDEIIKAIGVTPTKSLRLFVQIAGALYFGFAVTNWMAKTVLIGGIYARPLAMGNFAHFMIAAIALIKAAIDNSDSAYLLVITVIYALFAILFGMVVFRNPKSNQS